MRNSELNNIYDYNAHAQSISRFVSAINAEHDRLDSEPLDRGVCPFLTRVALKQFLKVRSHPFVGPAPCTRTFYNYYTL